MFRKVMVVAMLVFALLQGCGSGNSNTTGGTSGTVSLSITDAPAFGFDNVWITVKDLWFHASDLAEPGQGGWIRFPLSSPVTLDLLTLASGNISLPVWDNIEVPQGDYAQIRIFLAGTDAPLAPSASAEQLLFNNQVSLSGDPTAYPLRIPDGDRGIRLTGRFTVRKNEKLKLAIDFDAGHDVVRIEHDNKTDFILKPRLAYFDLDNAGAIIGSIDAAAAGQMGAARFDVKAEQVGPDGRVHVVRRMTTPADQSGRFVLFPLLPGNYDIVIRGINYRTTIIKGVPAIKGTRPDLQPTVMPAVTMTPALTMDYAANASITSPTGAWVHFFQTLPGTAEVPYEIRFRHFNPLTGRFAGFPLSSEPLQVGVYDASVISLQTMTPVEGNGGFTAMAGAVLHRSSGALLVSSTSTTLGFGELSAASPASSRTVSGSIIVPQSIAPGFLDRGVLFACHGGMIVNAVRVDSQMASGGTYTLSNLPGGTSPQPLPGAFYAVEAFGWSSAQPARRAAAHPKSADLTQADAAAVDLTMQLLP